MENLGCPENGHPSMEREGTGMYTISDIIEDIARGCTANNMLEDCFSYRIIFFVNDGNNGRKHYTDTTYSGLRKSLEGIVRNHLSLTNNLVIAQTTALKDGESICLQSRSYAFSLDEYFKKVSGDCWSGRKERFACGRYAAGK